MKANAEQIFFFQPEDNGFLYWMADASHCFDTLKTALFLDDKKNLGMWSYRMIVALR